MKFFKRKKEAVEQAVPPTVTPDTVAPAAPPAASVAPESEVSNAEIAADVETVAPAAPEEVADSRKPGFFSRLRHGLGRTSENLVQGMGTLFLGRKEIDEELLEELESRLLLADVGVDVQGLLPVSWRENALLYSIAKQAVLPLLRLW